ncbi:class I SAM-dependent methyltransferase [Diaminobutyricimonas sp. LJ205]|uniref:class I SAM-dependent methyltransferase n=1 Tax=Diaminobutyricimonas sp. LJ205 TaxID=2683590 RepID=UPI0012F49AA2|nr:class I SAM-dependent methyltransferase [Diaminobutyricimonas sp. LJ205]
MEDMVEGRVTRGTTGTNRLRRVDRWVAALPLLRRADRPLVVDLGYGASAATTLELHHRLVRVRPDVDVLGLEIDPERVRVASEQLDRWRAHVAATRALRTPRGGHVHPGSAHAGRIRFALGGFEVPTPGNRQATVIRAFNVLRQYDEHEVAAAWQRMVARLQPGGVLVEGTCSEIGRVSSWVAVTADGPRALTISLRLTDLEKPSIVAERLPKALIHRNVPGERVHELMNALDRHWQFNAGLSVYAPSQRWIATVKGLRADGWPLLGSRNRWRLGEVTVAWEAVAPLP